MKKGSHQTAAARKRIKDSRNKALAEGKIKVWNKGRKGLQKAWNKGIPASENAKRLNSEKHRGRIPWNKGKHGIYSEAVRRGMGAKNIGKPSPQAGRTLEGLYGKERAERIREAESEAKRGKPGTKLGATVSLAGRKNISKAKTGQKYSEIGKKNMSEAHIGAEFTLKHRNNMALAKVGIPRPQEVCDKLSASKTKEWEDPIKRMKYTKGLRQPYNDSERFLDGILQFHFPNQWKYTGDLTGFVGRKCPDFMHINRRLIIEYNGFFTHTTEKDEKKATYYAGYGYKTLNLEKRAIEDTDKLIERIKEFLESEN